MIVSVFQGSFQWLSCSRINLCQAVTVSCYCNKKDVWSPIMMSLLAINSRESWEGKGNSVCDFVVVSHRKLHQPHCLVYLNLCDWSAPWHHCCSQIILSKLAVDSESPKEYKNYLISSSLFFSGLISSIIMKRNALTNIALYSAWSLQGKATFCFLLTVINI